MIQQSIHRFFINFKKIYNFSFSLKKIRIKHNLIIFEIKKNSLKLFYTLLNNKKKNIFDILE